MSPYFAGAVESLQLRTPRCKNVQPPETIPAVFEATLIDPCPSTLLDPSTAAMEEETFNDELTDEEVQALMVATTARILEALSKPA